MIRQVLCPKADLTARIELVGSERTAIKGEDLEFFANLVMGLALSTRKEIVRARERITEAVQDLA